MVLEHILPLAGLFTLLFHAANAAAGVNTFAAPKSKNLDIAPAITSYKTVSPEDLEDAHAVVGIATADGGYVLAGKAMECADTCAGGQVSSKMEAFATKLSAEGGVVWSWRSNAAGFDDAANGVQELSDGSIIVVGWRAISATQGKASLTKLGSDGTEKWTYTGFSDASGKTSALELVTISGTTDLLLSGYKGKDGIEEMSFKSYGNSGGTAWVCKLPISLLSGNIVPNDGTLACTWEKTDSGYATSKASYAFSDGSVVALYWSEEKSANIIRYDADGTVMWGPKEYGESKKLEGTDLAISADGTKIALTGHGKILATNTDYSGKLVVIDAKDGTATSNTEISGGGNTKLIWNECWGVSSVSDGFVVACGSGIEECGQKTGADKVACEAGTGDPNEPTLHLGAGQWLSLVAKIDFSGTLKWQRADQWRPEGDPVYSKGTDFTATRSSASEWAFTKSDGATAYVNDETEGFGLLLLAKDDGAQSNDKSTAASVGNVDLRLAVLAVGVYFMSLV